MAERSVSKRSSFARIPRDLYNTPAKAVEPLLRILEPKTLFVEPCYGVGALRQALAAQGHLFCGGFDLPIDAREHDYGMKSPEFFITNPPYWGKPNDLHPLIENLSNQAPTWLLMSADWLFNQSSGPLTKRLRRIVAVGRVKWIPDSPYVGKDNAAWLLFEHQANQHFFVGQTKTARRSCLTPSRSPKGAAPTKHR
jgi:hypothetical protein